jgi:hypothetical protein
LPGWLLGWGNRKSHVINPASGAGTGYQVRIRAHYGSGTDSGEDVYLNGKCRTDFGDVRFTRSDGTTLLDYWMAEKSIRSYALFWVEVSDDLSSNPATIYVYYGNPEATTTSNGDATFPFFDDFLGTSLDPNKWGSVDSGIVYSVGNSKLTVTDDTASHWDVKAGFHHSGVPSQNGFEIRLKGFSWLQSGIVPIWMFGVVLSDTVGFDYELSVKHHDAWAGHYGEMSARIGGHYYGSGYDTLPQNGSAELAIRKDQNNSVRILWDGWVILGPYTDTVTLTEILLLVNRYETYEYPTTELDAVIWRKYVSPEPSHGAWGSEESVGAYHVTVQEAVRGLEAPEPSAVLYLLGRYPRYRSESIFGVTIYWVRQGDLILSLDHNAQVEAYNAIKRKLKEWGIL